MNSLQPNTLELRDQYGNVDTNNDGVINEKDDGYQTDVLYNPMGLGADKLNNVTNWVQSAYDENGNLKTGDWAGDVGDQKNAMDLLLSSEKFNKLIELVNPLEDSLDLQLKKSVPSLLDDIYEVISNGRITQEIRMLNLYLSQFVSKKFKRPAYGFECNLTSSTFGSSCLSSMFFAYLDKL